MPKMTDQDAVDAIATILGTPEDWDGAADFLESIADVIGAVRPHPGQVQNYDYRTAFKTATGRDVPERYDATPDPEPEDEEEDEQTYEIVRFYRDDTPEEIIETGLTLAEAKEHCSRDDTHGDGWFDGFRAE